MSDPPMSEYVSLGFSCIIEMLESASGGSTSTRALECRCSATEALGLSDSRLIVLRIRT